MAFLPAHVLRDGHALESLDRGLGCVLRLEIALENVDVVIEPLQILLFDRGNAFQHLAGVEYRLRGRERVGGSGRRLAFDELGAHAEALRIGSADAQVDLVSFAMDFGDFVDHLIVGRIDLSPTCGIGGDSRAAVFLRGLAMTPVSLLLLIRRHPT
jgi:hypothetical protein